MNLRITRYINDLAKKRGPNIDFGGTMGEIETRLMKDIKDKIIEMPHILIVDDEEPLLQLMDLALKRDYKVTTANTFDGGIEALMKHNEGIKLVLLDFYIEGMDCGRTGRDLFYKMREIKPDIRVIYMTGYSQLKSSDLSEPGVYGKILKKPFNIRDLKDETRNALTSCKFH